MQHSIFSVLGLLKFCFRYRLIISLTCILAIIVSSIVSLFFISPKFKSVVVISPTTTSSVSQALLIEDNPYKKDIFEFGNKNSYVLKSYRAGVVLKSCLLMRSTRG